MSSTGYYAKVVSVSGKEVVLEVRAGTAGGLADRVITRSFVLCLLGDLGRADGDVASESWVRDNCARYVENVTIDSIVGLTTDDWIRETSELYGLDVELLKPRVTMRARLATEQLASAFDVGAELETTGWDVWWNDPMRPVPPDATSPKINEPRIADVMPRMWSRVAANIAPWQVHGEASATFESGVMRWELELYRQELDPGPPELFVLQFAGYLPRLEGRRGLVKKKAPPPIKVLSAYHAGNVFRRRVGAERESPEALGERVRETMLRAIPMLETLSKQDVLLSVIEDRCAAMREKGFTRLVPKIEPPTPPNGLDHSAFSVDFFLRAAIYGALADDALAKAALAQTARWKRIPKPYAEMLQSREGV